MTSLGLTIPTTATERMNAASNVNPRGSTPVKSTWWWSYGRLPKGRLPRVAAREPKYSARPKNAAAQIALKAPAKMRLGLGPLIRCQLSQAVPAASDKDTKHASMAVSRAPLRTSIEGADASDLSNNPELLEDWRSAKRLKRKTKQPSAAARMTSGTKLGNHCLIDASMSGVYQSGWGRWVAGAL